MTVDSDTKSQPGQKPDVPRERERERGKNRRTGDYIGHLAEFIVAFNEQHMRLSLFAL